ncbi:NADH ubiquinone oxidoreductase, 20 kDa subunit [Caminibacter mediatlanticus TB-2]|uniref:NADH ubiquinone oxidoreductase, 20 kDa subunit n=2 Tax=Caminibacter mediatlanticus TaxID=291048 RepID=A0AAI9AIR5_9BACT|nr:NADH ubiquinone oxidoreductase, 20 kDa subunit [Caminibacter mediatlanticus TB-2]
MEMSSNPKIFRINTGSCNGCDVEIAASVMSSRFDLQKLGCEYIETSEDADIFMITGPVTARSLPFLKEVIKNHKKPYVVISLGTCSVTCGIFRDSYPILGPVDSYVNVDVNVAGCPPRPQAILEGVKTAIDILKRKNNEI